MSSPTVSRFFNHAVLVVTANISVKTSAFPPAHLLSASVSLHVGRSEAWHKCKCLLKQIPFLPHFELLNMDLHRFAHFHMFQ